MYETPGYITLFDSAGNEIWGNPNMSDAQLNQILNNTPADKKIEVVAKPTYLYFKIAAALLILFWWFKFKRK
jgi:hypothetical protein